MFDFVQYPKTAVKPGRLTADLFLFSLLKDVSGVAVFA
jgi:hypothetical protein